MPDADMTTMTPELTHEITIDSIKSNPDLKFQEHAFDNSPKQAYVTEANDNSGFGLGTKSNWLNLAYYTKYFNVTSEEAKERLISAALLDGSFLEKLNGRMDFYGPAWLSITVAILLFVSSSIAKSTWAHPGETLDFHLLTFGIVEMLLYTAFQTAVSWGFFRWRGVDGVKVGEMAALSGYSLVPLLPALLLASAPFNFTQWLAFTGAAAASCLFIYRNLWPILQTSPTIRHEQATLFITTRLAIHAIFFFALRVTFFRHLHTTK